MNILKIALAVFLTASLSACSQNGNVSEEKQRQSTDTQAEGSQATEQSTGTDRAGDPGAQLEVQAGDTRTEIHANGEDGNLQVKANGKTIIEATDKEGEDSGQSKVKINLPGIKVDIDEGAGSVKVDVPNKVNINLNSPKDAR